MNQRQVAVEAGVVLGTMLDAPQLDWLYYLARLAPDGPAVEVGVWKGGSVTCWARARRDRGPVYAVDTWYDGESQHVRRAFLANVERSGLDVQLIELPGHEAAERFEDSSVAFCFIDADHGEGGITRDLPAWAVTIKPGGILVLHDWGVWKPTVVVKREVERWQARDPWELLGLVGSAIAFRRPVTEENTPDANCTQASL